MLQSQTWDGDLRDSNLIQSVQNNMNTLLHTCSSEAHNCTIYVPLLKVPQE